MKKRKKRETTASKWIHKIWGINYCFYVGTLLSLSIHPFSLFPTEGDRDHGAVPVWLCGECHTHGPCPSHSVLAYSRMEVQSSSGTLHINMWLGLVSVVYWGMFLRLFTLLPSFLPYFLPSSFPHVYYDPAMTGCSMIFICDFPEKESRKYAFGEN